jgi:hypothetical protein
VACPRRQRRLPPASQFCDGCGARLDGAAAGSSVLLPFTYRPGCRHSFGDRSYHVRIAPQALSRDEMAAMAPSLLETEAPGGLRTRGLVDRRVPSLPEEGLQRGLRALGERLAVDPLGA